MAHTSAEEIIKKWQEAVALVPPGSRWFHYKQPDQLYTIRGIAMREESEEPGVLYHPDYDNYPADFVWDRPLSEWFSPVEDQQGRKTTRFQKLTK